MRKGGWMIACAGPGWAVASNRELAAGLGNSIEVHLGMMNRKLALRAQQMTFCSAGHSPYMRFSASAHRLPS